MVDLLGVRVLGGHPVVVLGQRLHADPAAAPHHVQEEVGGDAVQPALEGAGLIVLDRPEHPDEGLLGQVLGVVLVTGEPVGQAVHPVGVLPHQFVPGRHGGQVAGGVEHGGALRLVAGFNPGRRVLLEVGHAGRGHQWGGRRILLVVAAE